LAIVTGSLLLLYLLFYLFLIWPMAQQVALKREDVRNKQKAFQARGFPADAAFLESLLADKSRDYDWLKTRWQDINTLANAGFLKRITAKYGSLPQFMSQISRLDYQEEYSRIERDLGRYNLQLAEEVLGLGENTVAPDIAPLMVQLWTLENAVKTALQEQLVPVTVTYTPKKVPEKTDPANPAPAKPITAPLTAADLSLLPARQYVLNPADTRAFLHEYPLRLRLRGPLQNFCNFLVKIAYLPSDNATSEKPFLPVSRMEIHSLPPDAGGDNRELIEVELECSTFFVYPQVKPEPPAPAAAKAPEQLKPVVEKAVKPAGSP